MHFIRTCIRILYTMAGQHKIKYYVDRPLAASASTTQVVVTHANEIMQMHAHEIMQMYAKLM